MNMLDWKNCYNQKERVLSVILAIQKQLYSKFILSLLHVVFRNIRSRSYQKSFDE